MTGKLAKHAFKTFNKNASALEASPSMQSTLREIMETLTLHGTLINELSETEAPESEDFVTEDFGGGGGLEFDEADLILHQEVFGS